MSNSVNTALSLPAPLTVISNSALTFLSVPAGQTNYQGSKVTLGATVLGSGPVSYQWYYSANNQIFTAVPGANSDSLVFDPALAGQSGYYRVVASNQFSTVTSPSTYERVLFAKAWGYLPADPSIIVTNATAIAVGNLGTGNPYGHYLVLKSDGTISSWIGSLQYPQYGQTNFSALINSIVTAIAAGYGDSLALKSDGTVYATGFGIYGETNVPAGLSGVTAIACGDYHDLALKSDGTIAGWGQNNYGQATNALMLAIRICSGDERRRHRRWREQQHRIARGWLSYHLGAIGSARISGAFERHQCYRHLSGLRISLLCVQMERWSAGETILTVRRRFQ